MRNYLKLFQNNYNKRKRKTLYVWIFLYKSFHSPFLNLSNFCLSKKFLNLQNIIYLYVLKLLICFAKDELKELGVFSKNIERDHKHKQNIEQIIKHEPTSYFSLCIFCFHNFIHCLRRQNTGRPKKHGVKYGIVSYFYLFRKTFSNLS